MGADGGRGFRGWAEAGRGRCEVVEGTIGGREPATPRYLRPLGLLSLRPEPIFPLNLFEVALASARSCTP